MPSMKLNKINIDLINITRVDIFRKKVTELIAPASAKNQKNNPITLIVNRSNRKLLSSFNKFVIGISKRLPKKLKRAFKTAESLGLFMATGLANPSGVNQGQLKSIKTMHTPINLERVATFREKVKAQLVSLKQDHDHKNRIIALIIDRSNKQLLKVINVFARNPNKLPDKKLQEALETARNFGLFRAAGISVAELKFANKGQCEPIKITSTPLERVATFREIFNAPLASILKQNRDLNQHLIASILDRSNKQLLELMNFFARNFIRLPRKKVQKAVEITRKLSLFANAQELSIRSKVANKKQLELNSIQSARQITRYTSIFCKKIRKTIDLLPKRDQRRGALLFIIKHSNKLPAFFNNFPKNFTLISNKKFKKAFFIAKKLGLLNTKIFTFKPKLVGEKQFKSIKSNSIPLNLEHAVTLRKKINENLAASSKQTHKSCVIASIINLSDKQLLLILKDFAKNPNKLLNKKLKEAFKKAQSLRLLKAAGISYVEPKSIKAPPRRFIKINSISAAALKQAAYIREKIKTNLSTSSVRERKNRVIALIIARSNNELAGALDIFTKNPDSLDKRLKEAFIVAKRLGFLESNN
jgi:hypothetical protein